jgi:hypothetical protein
VKKLFFAEAKKGDDSVLKMSEKKKLLAETLQ